jgi:hypothetical protein
MDIIVTHTITVLTKNPIGFCADKDRHLLAALRKQYEGVCYMGAFIREILRVVRPSKCRIVETNNTGHGQFNVMFEARAVVIPQWHILLGVKIHVISPIRIGIAPVRPGQPPEDVTVSLRPQHTDSLRIGQIVPARVAATMYKPLEKRIFCEAVLLTCDRQAPVFHIEGRRDLAQHADALRPLVAMIREELRLRARDMEDPDKRTRYWMFEQLLYSYGAAPAREGAKGAAAEAEVLQVATANGEVDAWEGPVGLPIAQDRWTGWQAVNILQSAIDATNGNPVILEGYWSRGIHLHRSSPLTMHLANIKQAKGAAAPVPSVVLSTSHVVSMTAEAMVLDHLTSMLNFLSGVRGLVEIYNTPELLDDHKNVWNAMRATQYSATAPATASVLTARPAARPAAAAL